jgi:hypothetical protein
MYPGITPWKKVNKIENQAIVTFTLQVYTIYIKVCYRRKDIQKLKMVLSQADIRKPLFFGSCKYRR